MFCLIFITITSRLPSYRLRDSTFFVEYFVEKIKYVHWQLSFIFMVKCILLRVLLLFFRVVCEWIMDLWKLRPKHNIRRTLERSPIGPGKVSSHPWSKKMTSQSKPIIIFYQLHVVHVKNVNKPLKIYFNSNQINFLFCNTI